MTTTTQPIFTDCGALDGHRTRLFRDGIDRDGSPCVEWCFAVDYAQPGGTTANIWRVSYMRGDSIAKRKAAGHRLTPFGNLTDKPTSF